MKVLVGCEFSGNVRNAFRAKGCEAWSCDIIPSLDNSEFHLQCDLFEAIKSREWDMLIAHPPCTYLCVSGSRWWNESEAEQIYAVQFFMDIVTCNVHKICIENPVGLMSNVYRKPDQIIQPWMFGHGETKKTCLWLKNLQPLVPTNIVPGRVPKIHHMSPGIVNGLTQGQRRSITYPGIALAMAEQWNK